jgi:hypothetical protein
VVHFILFPHCEFFQPLLCTYSLFHHFPDIKTKGVPWYISCYSPAAHFFQPSCDLLRYTTTSWMVKLTVVHLILFPRCEFFLSSTVRLSITVLHTTLPGIKIDAVPWYISYYSPVANFFSLACRLFIIPQLPGY